MIWRCRPVVPDKIFWSYQIDDLCYAYLPIQVNNETFYAVPGSRDLVKFSPVVDCNHHTVGIYFDKDIGWRTTSGKSHVTPFTFEVSWKGQFKMFTFDAPSFFHNQIFNIFQTLGLFQTHSFRLFELEMQFQRMMTFTANLSLDSSVVYNFLAGSGQAANTFMQG